MGVGRYTESTQQQVRQWSVTDNDRWCVGCRRRCDTAATEARRVKRVMLIILRHYLDVVDVRPSSTPRYRSTSLHLLWSPRSLFLADRTARSMNAIGMILSSVCPPVCDAVHCSGETIHPTAIVSEEVNRKCPIGTRFYSFQTLHRSWAPKNCAA